MAISSEGQQGLQAANSGFWNAVNLGWNSIQNMKDKEWQAKFWKATYDRQLKDNLKYNSPSAQMARMKSAGLNTNLMYGNGVGETAFSLGGTPGSIGSHGASAMPSYDPLIKAQIDNLDADTANKLEENKGISLTNEAQKIANSFASQLNQAQIDNLRKDLDVKDKDIKEKQQRIDQMLKQINLTDEQIKQLKETIKSIEMDNAYKKAVNDLKIPLLEEGFDPDVSVTQMLAKFLVTTFVGWKSDPNSILGSIFRKILP